MEGGAMSDREHEAHEEAEAPETAGVLPREMTADQKAADPAVVPEEPKQRSFPSALGILAAVILLVWVATFFIDSGRFQLDEDGQPVPGSFENVDSPLDFRDKVWELVLSPINGLYGIRDADTGQVGPFNSGTLFGSAQVFLFILAIGGFMTVVFATGALDRGISLLANRFRARGALLIIVMSLVFALLGSVMSWSDEQLAFFALFVPLMLALGYDRLVVMAVVAVSGSIGSIGATVTPFRIGIGSDAAGVSIGDGIGLRLVLFALAMGAFLAYTLRYAKRVQADPSSSMIGFTADDEAVVAEAKTAEIEPLTGRQKIILVLFVGTFLLLTFSIIPWTDILGGNTVIADYATHETETVPYSWELGWWLPELSALFIVMAIVIGLIGGLGESGIAGNFIKGVVDFTGPAFLVAVARGVSVILNNTQTLDTVLNAMEDFVSGRSEVVFVLLMSIVALPLGFLVGSGSAGMALVMPVLAPLGDFAGVDRSLVVTIYNAIGAWLNLVLPTNAILMASLALAKVRYDVYLRWLAPLMGILLVIIVAVCLVGAAL
jgi:uncharacterized ion transporter superfamily protein YfcC